MEKASSACRRLRQLVLHKPTPKTAAAVATPTTQQKFENVVEKFKKRSNSGGFRAQRSHYQATVRRLARAGRFSQIEDILQHQKQYPDIKNEHFAARLIHLYGYAKMLDHALQLFDEMPQLNCPRTVHSFNTLLSACFPSRNFEKAIELFRDLPPKLSIQPNVISYASAMKALCRNGSFDNAVSLLDEMAANGVDPDAVTFSVLLGELYLSGRFVEGENAWNLMREKNVDPDLRCYNWRLLGMVREKQLGEGVELVREMEEKGLQLNSYTYNLLIKAFIIEGDAEEVKKWYAALEESSTAAPDIFTYVQILPFALDCIGVDFALDLCKKAVGLKKKLPIKMVGRVSDELVKQSRDDEAKELIHLYNLPPLIKAD